MPRVGNIYAYDSKKVQLHIWLIPYMKDTVNRLYTDIRHNDKTRFNDNWNGTTPSLKAETDYWRNEIILYLTFQETYIVDYLFELPQRCEAISMTYVS